MIPKIIHQSWKTEQVPDRWLPFQKSWRDHHPDYDYQFWTDDRNRDFIARVFPQFLALYDGYKHPINRADLARYLVVAHHGGVYADLDCESVKPIDDLLSDRDVLFGYEPQSHAAKPAVTSRGLSRIVCNALFASAPQDPFWLHLFEMLVLSKDEGNILEATGPFILTRALACYPDRDKITILPAEVLYPLDHFLLPTRPEPGSAMAGEPYAIHHWAGTWWRGTVLRNARSRILAARQSDISEVEL